MQADEISKWFIAARHVLRTVTADFAICLSLVLLGAHLASAQPAGIVDTHAHIQGSGRRGQDFRGGLEAAIRRMDQYGIRRMVLMPPPMVNGTYDIEAYSFAKEAYAGRVLLGGGGGGLNPMLHGTAPGAVTDDIKKSFRERAEQIVAAGAVVFGEIAIHHLSISFMGPDHPYEWTPPDHPLLLLLADIAAEKNIPIDFHMDLVPEDMKLPDRRVFNPTNPALLKANMAGFERLLAHNRGARIVWVHAGTDPLGTRTPQIQRDLLLRNPNLFMSLRLGASGPARVMALAEDKSVKPFWLALLRRFADRFVIGTDFFHTPAGAGSQRGPGEETLGNYRAALAQMPPEVAEAIARRNAEKIYRLGDQ